MSPEVQAAMISAASDWTLFLCEWLHAGPTLLGLSERNLNKNSGIPSRESTSQSSSLLSRLNDRGRLQLHDFPGLFQYRLYVLHVAAHPGLRQVSGLWCIWPQSSYGQAW